MAAMAFMGGGGEGEATAAALENGGRRRRRLQSVGVGDEGDDLKPVVAARQQTSTSR